MSYSKHTYNLQILKSFAPDVPLSLGSDRTWAEAAEDFVSDTTSETERSALTDFPEQSERFTPEWSARKWAEWLSREESYRQWSERTVLLTFTGRTTLPESSQPMLPLDHYEYVRGTRVARSRALSDALHDVDTWRSVTFVGVNQSGYLHEHTGVWVGEDVHRDRFEAVVGAHVNNTPESFATSEAHGSGAIRLKSGDSRGLVAEMGTNVPGLDSRGRRGHGVLNEPVHQVLGATLLNEGEFRAIRHRVGPQ